MAFTKYHNIIEGNKKAFKINGNISRNTIPAGVECEQQIKISGLGGKDVTTGPKGDLHSTATNENHKNFTLKKHNLNPAPPPDQYTSIFNIAITDNTYVEKVKLTVKPETQNGIEGPSG